MTVLEAKCSVCAGPVGEGAVFGVDGTRCHACHAAPVANEPA